MARIDGASGLLERLAGADCWLTLARIAVTLARIAGAHWPSSPAQEVPLHSAAISSVRSWVITLLRQLLMSCCLRSGGAARGALPLAVAVIVVCGLFVSPGARAAEGDALLEVDQPLAGHGAAEQQVALQEALRRVLVRLSGRQDMGRSAGMLRAFAEPHRYAAKMAFAVTGAGEVLRVQFARPALESLLKSAGLPLWSARRPTLVLWLLTDAPRRGVIGRNSSDGLLAALRAEARERGLPLVVPLGDAGEAGTVTTAVDAKVFTPVAAVSGRYGSQVALVGRVRNAGGGRDGQWWLIDPFSTQNIVLSGATTADQASAAIEWAIRRVASSANARTADGPLVAYPAIVTGVHTFDDYAGVLNAIRDSKVVNEVDVTAYGDDRLDLLLRSRVPFSILARGVAGAAGLSVPFAEREASAPAPDGAVTTAAAEQSIRLRWSGSR